ncbi:hypothetical protein [Bacillus sp. LLTC93]|uniref:hypothetical protein n=1 Tax=Bacillus sp. LLTC93 TaxID=2108274 RepID=UPI000D014C88|nr:hypothetical protein [Bacillus sp. LLTC93]PRO41488.1 hypothetical protein C6W18_05600 [Bacillus sp. LLTC93]
MISIKNVKDGGVAYVFGEEYADVAKVMFPRFAEKLLGGEGVSLPEPKKQRTLVDIKNSINKPQSDARLCRSSKLTGKALHHEISQVMLRAENLFGVSRRKIWGELYEKLRQETGVDPRNVKRSTTKGMDRGSSKISTYVKDGYGQRIVEIAYEIYDKYEAKS